MKTAIATRPVPRPGAASVLLAVALLTTLPAAGQAPGACVPDIDPEECVAALASQLATDQLNRLETGPDTAGESIESNKKNFLPFLALTGLFNEGADLDDSGTLVLDLNAGRRFGHDAQLKAVAHTAPKVSPVLRDALPQADRDDLVAGLEDDLADTDDAALELTYGYTGRFLGGRQVGRRFELYEAQFAALSAQAIGPETAKLVAEGLLAGTLTEEKLAALETTATKAMLANNLDRFHKLVDNQPQLLFSIVRKFRDSLVGPEELGFKVTYEHGRFNLNRLKDELAAAPSAEKPAPCPNLKSLSDNCLAAYSTYVAEHAAAIDQGDRFSFSAEYVDLDDDVIDPGIDGFEPLAVESATKLIVSAGWSRRFDVGGGEEPVLLDVVGSYEDVSDDPMRQDRGVITLTITRNFAGVPVPLGIVYANHGEYLGDVDERLSAHVGLKFNAFGTKKK